MVTGLVIENAIFNLAGFWYIVMTMMYWFLHLFVQVRIVICLIYNQVIAK